MIRFVLALTIIIVVAACGSPPPHDSDSEQRRQQETILAEGTAQIGMPSITHFRERKLMKDILELRDEENLITYTYLVSYTGELVFLCQSIGYPIPYSTQFTSPQKPMWDRGEHNGGNISLPQADPNGLFSPVSADATWIMCKDPHSDNVKVAYVEPLVLTFPFPMETAPPATAEK